MLNQRQELFCQNIFNGMTQRDAWIKAGYSSKYNVADIDTHACQLANTDKVKTRLQELNAPIIARVQSTKNAKLQVLETIYTHEPLPENISSRDRIQAISEHNKMAGDYAPEKHALLGDIVIEVIHRDKGG